MALQERSVQDIYGNEAIQEIEEVFWDLTSQSKLKEKQIDVSQIIKTWKIADIKAKFGSLYPEVVRILSTKRKGKNIKEVIKYLDYRVRNILDLFVDTKIYDNVWNHLRDYQETFVRGILDFIFLNSKQTGYIHSATSTGKTTMFADVIRNILEISPDKKILITVPSLEALKRIKEELLSLGIDFWEFSGRKKDVTKSVTIATTQSMLNHLIKLQSWEVKDWFSKTDFDLMICDEIHNRLLGQKTRTVLEYFTCKKIWFTATPELLDKSVEELFQVKIWEYLVDEAIQAGYLPSINDEHSIELEDSEFQKLEKSGEDYTKESLAKMDISSTFPAVAKLLSWSFVSKQIAIFLPSVQASRDLSLFLSQQWIWTAHIDWNSTDQERDTIKQSFETWEIQVICSCDVLRESWDSDSIDGVIILRPTLSPAVYMQMIGRALHGKDIVNNTRKPKKEVFVADIVSNRSKIVGRNITTRSLKYLMNITRQESLRTRNIVYIDVVNYINEILLYYDISTDKESNIQKIFTTTLKRFAELFSEDEHTFFKNLAWDYSFYSYKKETIFLEFESNRLFWASFSGRKRNLEVDIESFLHIFKILYGESYFIELIEKKSVNSLEQKMRDMTFAEFVEMLHNFGPKIRHKLEFRWKLYKKSEFLTLFFLARFWKDISWRRDKNEYLHLNMLDVFNWKITTFEQFVESIEDMRTKHHSPIQEVPKWRIPLNISPDISEFLHPTRKVVVNTDISKYEFFSRIPLSDIATIITHFHTYELTDSPYVNWERKIDIRLVEKYFKKKYKVETKIFHAKTWESILDWDGIDLIFDNTKNKEAPSYVKMSWYQVWNAVLCYVLEIRSPEERMRYWKIAQWLLFLVKNQEIQDLDELETRFEELKKMKRVWNMVEYLWKNIVERDFSELFEAAKKEPKGCDFKFGIFPSVSPKLALMYNISWGEIYDSILKYKCKVVDPKARKRYAHIMRILFFEVKEWNITSWKELEERFHTYKIKNLNFHKTAEEIFAQEYMLDVPYDIFIEYMEQSNLKDIFMDVNNFHQFLLQKKLKTKSQFLQMIPNFIFLIFCGKLWILRSHEWVKLSNEYLWIHQKIMLKKPKDWDEYREAVYHYFEESKKNKIKGRLYFENVHFEKFILDVASYIPESKDPFMFWESLDWYFEKIRAKLFRKTTEAKYREKDIQSMKELRELVIRWKIKSFDHLKEEVRWMRRK